MQVGVPRQQLRLLPSTSGNAIWPVLKGACPSDEPDSCTTLRGSFFNPNESTTWSNIGLYGLLLTEEGPLGLAANGIFGFDQATLGFPGSPDMPTLNHTIIGGFLDTSLYVGTLGLYPPAVNLSTFNDPQLSFIASLRNQKSIPSTSWAYTAGAQYKQPTAFGSLTLGGYDTTRFKPNTISYSFGPDQSRDLVVGLQDIQTNNKSLLPTGIYTFLDSLVPDIWLPIEACQRFESAFGLSYNDTAQRYLVNDTHHVELAAKAPTITLRLGPSSSSGPSSDIVMSYGSLDLSYQDVKSGYKSRYFPLRRADNASMYTLGRSFFQDAYVVADYERKNFSVSQGMFPNSSNAQSIVAILPPGPVASANVKRFGRKEMAATIASSILFMVVVTAFVWWWRGKQRQNHLKEKEQRSNSTSPSNQIYLGNELPSSNTRHELQYSRPITPELENPDRYPFSGLTHTRRENPAEMAVNEQVSAALQGLNGRPRLELPGEEVV